MFKKMRVVHAGRLLLGGLMLAFSMHALASTDITRRDIDALRGVHAMVMLEPQLDEAVRSAGVTPAIIERRAAVYLKGIGVDLLTGSTQESGDRGPTPSLLIQVAASPGARGTNTFVTLNLVRESVDGSLPVYVTQQRGLTRHKLTRTQLMKEMDLALNLLREDLRRARY
ncbi:hypothetical protein [Diaphorobacter sp.]|uniref:hypothetical protein n=1 Tax=Diaphorobacter sp. TaxID=1934310 RepID=UPI0028AC8934|nr:hypothetical protein [Diaphorobacter sp.]